MDDSTPQPDRTPPPLEPPAGVSLVILPEQPCSYFPQRVSRTRAMAAHRMAPDVYHALMDRGFRRSGRIIYQPICDGCRACQPIRVPVPFFMPNKSQRRTRRRNQDVAVDVATPIATDEKFDLYRHYATEWHGRDAREEDRETFETFLYDSPVKTLEFSYRDSSGRLLGVGICDVCDQSLSSVYFYFDPAEARRGLGTFSAMVEIETAAAMKIPHYYLGFWIAGCRAMEYKSTFRPFELLQSDGTWRRPYDSSTA